jgi:Pectinacetylesterase
MGRAPYGLILLAAALASCGSADDPPVFVNKSLTCSSAGGLSIPGDAPFDTWTWIGCSDTACANGAPTGMGIQPHPGAKWTLIYLSGGGVCWDYDTCVAQPRSINLASGFSWQSLLPAVSTVSFFHRDDPANPFRDANLVFVPYCTGDLHGGSKTTVYESTPISHMGYRNLSAFLARVAPTFASSDVVAISGSSAGAYGAVFNYEQTRQAFAAVGHAKVVVVSDAGPPLRPPYFPTGLEDLFVSNWNILANLPAGCTACNPDVPGGGLHNLWSYYAQDPSFVASLLTTRQDDGISLSFSYPPWDANLLCNPSNPLLPCTFNPALEDTLDAVVTPGGRSARVRTFVADGFQHTFGVYPLAPVVDERGVSLTDFLVQEMNGYPDWSSTVCDGVPDDQCVCNTLVNTAPNIEPSWVDAPPPQPTGGALVGGLYRCVSATLYGPSPPPTPPVHTLRESMMMQPSSDGATVHLDRVTSGSLAADEGSSMTITGISGGNLTGQQDCPTKQPVRIPYSASPQTLTLYEPGSGSAVMELVYALAPP